MEVWSLESGVWDFEGLGVWSLSLESGLWSLDLGSPDSGVWILDQILDSPDEVYVTASSGWSKSELGPS